MQSKVYFLPEKKKVYVYIGLALIVPGTNRVKTKEGFKNRSPGFKS